MTAAKVVFCLLALKRLFSSPAAFALTPEAHLESEDQNPHPERSVVTPGTADDQAVDAPYQPGAPDWSTTDPSQPLVSGASACGYDICFAGEVDRVNNAKIPYQPVPGPNSNSFAYSMLTNCGLPQSSTPPFGLAPGWGKSI
jgi:hypothetical protein